MTLVEILVVVMIMGVVGAVVLLSVAPRQGEAERAARGFAGEAAALADLAVTSSRTIGLSGGRAITLHRFADGAWTETSAMPLPQGVRSTLTPADELLPPDPPSNKTLILYRPPGEEEREEAPPPPVMLSPTGEATPFTALFDDGGERWTVAVDASGRTEVTRAE